MQRTGPRQALQIAVVLGAVVALGAGPRTAAAADATYANARFGYSIAYPAGLFVAQPEAANGDGRRFNAHRSSAYFLVYGGYNALDRTPDEIARDESRDCGGGRVSYRVVKPQLVAISCVTPQGVIRYAKTLIDGDVLTTFEMSYPRAERARWDPVLARMSRSLAAATSATGAQGAPDQ